MSPKPNVKAGILLLVLFGSKVLAQNYTPEQFAIRKNSFLFFFRPLFIIAMLLLCIVLKAVAQPECATSERLVQTNFFDFGAAGDDRPTIANINQYGWRGGGPGSFDAGPSNTRFTYNGGIQTMTQSLTDVNLKGTGANVSLNIASNDFATRPQSNGAVFRISYGGVTYCTITNPVTPRTDPENASIQYSNGASGSRTSMPVTDFRRISYVDLRITLPAGIPNNGDLVLTFDASGNRNDDFRLRTVSVKSCPIVYSGTVFHDPNGLNNGAIDGTGTNLSDSLSIGLYDENDIEIMRTPVNSDGTYSFSYPNSGNYTLRLLGLPDGYNNTGEKTGSEGDTGDGTPNGITSVIQIQDGTENSDKSDNDFGVNQTPVSEDVSQTVTPQGNSIPQGALTTPVSGNDPEDGALGNGNKVAITELPTNGKLFYNGNEVQTGQVIENFDPALLSFTELQEGTTSTSFKYSFVDEAGAESAAPATYTVSWEESLPVSFGPIKAHIVNGELLVAWSTLKESNNDRFEIEASSDGVNFRKIGTVDTKAKDGNSSEELQYEFSGPVKGAMSVAGLSLLFAGLLLLFANRRSRLLMMACMIFGSGLFMASCKKTNPGSIEDDKLFIRIVQVDIDGGRDVSKTVQATRE